MSIIYSIMNFKLSTCPTVKTKIKKRRARDRPTNISPNSPSTHHLSYDPIVSLLCHLSSSDVATQATAFSAQSCGSVLVSQLHFPTTSNPLCLCNAISSHEVYLGNLYWVPDFRMIAQSRNSSPPKHRFMLSGEDKKRTIAR